MTFSTDNEEFDFNLILESIDKILEKYGHKRKKEKTQICLLKDSKCPTITGIWIKRHKVRASSKMYKKMISNYRWLISNPIVDGASFKCMETFCCFRWAIKYN